MRKTIALLLALLYATSLFAIDCGTFPQKTNPPQAVNDFAGIMDPNVRLSLETQLENYWNKTSIAIAVVTVKSLNGNDVEDYATEFFRCWGIGDKTDRGVLLLIAFDDHKITLRTGYGIEYILPDNVCKRITEYVIKPEFKKKNFTLGIKNGVESLVSQLGTMSWEDRKAAEKKKAEIEAVEEQKIKETRDTILLSGFFITLLSGIIFLIYRYFRARNLRKALKATIARLQNQVTLAEESFKKIKNGYEVLPQWAQTEINHHSSSALGKINEAKSLLANASKQVVSDREQAAGDTLHAHDLIESASLNFKKIDVQLRAKIKKISEDAPVLLQNAIEVVDKLSKNLGSYISQGYTFENDFKKVIGLASILSGFQSKISQIELHKEIVETQAGILTQADEVAKAMHKAVSTKELIDQNTDYLVQDVVEMYIKKNQYTDIIAKMQKLYPQEFWQPLEVALNSMLTRMLPDKIKTLKESILSNNSFKEKKFAQALVEYEKLTKISEDAKTIITEIAVKFAEQENCKKRFPGALASAEERVEKAFKEIKNSDVGTTAKEYAKNAGKILNDAKLQSSGTMINWILVLLLLNQSEEKAREAIRKAKSDVDSAEEERRSAKRRREASAALSSSSSYSSSYSSSSSIFSGGGGGGGFGGFGGGSTGGGGGTSSW